jgi:putative ABC transport system permease protein
LLKVALKGLLARKLRTALTGFAVVIGVAFVAGTFVFTDTIDASFKDLFERASKGTDVSVQSRVAVEEDFATPPPMEASTLERVQSVDGVEEAAGFVSADATLLDPEGDPITSGGPPTLLLSSGPERFDPFTYTEGGPPDSDDEVVIDKATADEFGWHEGDKVTVAAREPQKQYTVSGIARLGDSDNLAGSRMVLMTLDEAQRVLREPGYSDISVAAAPGTSPEELKARIARELGSGYTVRTGEEQAEASAQDLSDALGFIRTALLVFAGVAVLVGGFLIFNTFSVTVAQRSREFALLRTLGASRAQLLNSVILETLVIGFAASVIGIAAGLAVAPGLRALLGAFGLDLGSTSNQLEPRTVIVALLVGMLATVVSGFVPARRATRVQPVEAMREADTPGPGRLRRRRVVVALLVEAAGVALLLYGLLGDPGPASATASVLGVGTLLMIFGLALLAPTLVRPLSAVIGAPLIRFNNPVRRAASWFLGLWGRKLEPGDGGLTARLARENSMRQPQRTAVTASALMIGVALVVLVAIFAAGLRATIDQGIDEQVRASSIVTHEDGFSPLSEEVVERLRDVNEVQAVSSIRFETGRIVGESGNTGVTGVDADTVRDVLTLNWDEGSDALLTELGTDRAVISNEFADSHDLAVGDTLRLTTPRGNEASYEITGIYDSAAGVVGGVVVSNQSLVTAWDANDVAFALVAAAPGTNPESLKRAEQSALAEFPTAKPQTIEDFKEEQNRQVDGLVGLVYALLSLSVLVALLGIVNTLALSVHERTRELGMLRAVGMSRRQVRKMVRGESVITAFIGAALGTVLGIAFAALLSRPLADEGFVFEIPIGTLVAVAILASVAGVLAGWSPARRAAKVDVLRAVTTE